MRSGGKTEGSRQTRDRGENCACAPRLKTGRQAFCRKQWSRKITIRLEIRPSKPQSPAGRRHATQYRALQRSSPESHTLTCGYINHSGGETV